MVTGKFYTVTEVSDLLRSPPGRVRYVLDKHRISPAARCGLVRLFSPEQIELIKDGLKSITYYRDRSA